MATSPALPPPSSLPTRADCPDMACASIEHRCASPGCFAHRLHTPAMALCAGHLRIAQVAAAEDVRVLHECEFCGDIQRDELCAKCRSASVKREDEPASIPDYYKCAVSSCGNKFASDGGVRAPGSEVLFCSVACLRRLVAKVDRDQLANPVCAARPAQISRHEGTTPVKRTNIESASTDAVAPDAPKKKPRADVARMRAQPRTPAFLLAYATLLNDTHKLF